VSIRRNYTREIRRELAKGWKAVVSSIGEPEPVEYAPRSKGDPLPWKGVSYRYTGREVHVVPSCGEKLLSFATSKFVLCTLPKGHDRAHRSVKV
jgi:hypothetical protein